MTAPDQIGSVASKNFLQRRGRPHMSRCTKLRAGDPDAIRRISEARSRNYFDRVNHTS